MKTSEFKKWLDDNEWIYEEDVNSINVFNYAKLYKKMYTFKLFDNTYVRESEKELLKKAIEYAETPILEREDEKKYIILVPFYIDSFGMNNYTFSRHQDKDNSKITRFTEKEIKAIDERLMAFAEEVK